MEGKDRKEKKNVELLFSHKNYDLILVLFPAPHMQLYTCAVFPTVCAHAPD